MHHLTRDDICWTHGGELCRTDSWYDVKMQLWVPCACGHGERLDLGDWYKLDKAKCRGQHRHGSWWPEFWVAEGGWQRDLTREGIHPHPGPGTSEGRNDIGRFADTTMMEADGIGMGSTSNPVPAVASQVVSGAPAAQDEVEEFLQMLREAAQQVETIDFSQLTDEEREEMKTMIVRMIERLHSAPNAHPPAPDDHAVV